MVPKVETRVRAGSAAAAPKVLAKPELRGQAAATASILGAKAAMVTLAAVAVVQAPSIYMELVAGPAT
ncbi:MAG: hypothetical protein Q7T63_18170 [Burkholderiaceae bacterium]|nr:hypothetical protein [Burkholderiaceae bacterium]